MQSPEQLNPSSMHAPVQVEVRLSGVSGALVQLL